MTLLTIPQDNTMTTPVSPKTVGELIAILQTYPMDLRVVVDGYEYDFDDLHIYVDAAQIEGNPISTWWGGKHSQIEEPDEIETIDDWTPVLVLSRYDDSEPVPEALQRVAKMMEDPDQ